MKKIILACSIMLCLFTSCSTGAEKETGSKEKYEKSKLSIEEIEQQSPGRFLSVKGTDKKNLLGQTVIKGKIINQAKMVTYKDVDIKLSFYSKTGTLLMEDSEIIYETVNPGATISFKSKYFSPKGTDSIVIKVISAKY